MRAGVPVLSLPRRRLALASVADRPSGGDAGSPIRPAGRDSPPACTAGPGSADSPLRTRGDELTDMDKPREECASADHYGVGSHGLSAVEAKSPHAILRIEYNVVYSSLTNVEIGIVEKRVLHVA